MNRTCTRRTLFWYSLYTQTQHTALFIHCIIHILYTIWKFNSSIIFVCIYLLYELSDVCIGHVWKSLIWKIPCMKSPIYEMTICMKLTLWNVTYMKRPRTFCNKGAYRLPKFRPFWPFCGRFKNNFQLLSGCLACLRALFGQKMAKNFWSCVSALTGEPEKFRQREVEKFRHKSRKNLDT